MIRALSCCSFHGPIWATFALERAKRVENVIVPLRQGGATLQAIADALNAASVPTARGGQWHPAQVQRMLERLEGAE